jgi:hypothetical protein
MDAGGGGPGFYLFIRDLEEGLSFFFGHSDHHHHEHWIADQK